MAPSYPYRFDAKWRLLWEGRMLRRGAWLGERWIGVGRLSRRSSWPSVWTFKGRTVPGSGKAGTARYLVQVAQSLSIMSRPGISFLLNSTNVRATRSMLGGLRRGDSACVLQHRLDTKFTACKAGRRRPAVAFLAGRGLNIL